MSWAERDDLLRTLQLAGHAALVPWTARRFAALDLSSFQPQMEGHPWEGTVEMADSSAPGVRWLPVGLTVGYQSAFPVSRHDGATWAGRGVTVDGSFGFTGRFGRISTVLAPEGFWAENRSFELAPNGYSGDAVYGDALYPAIDRPQRFGAEAYGRLGWGQSSVAIEGIGLELTLSSANHTWGPATFYPLLIGRDGPGFGHVSVGTALPRTTPVGSFSGRVIWGTLDQSRFAPPSVGERRLLTGWLVVFQPKPVAGLELGVSRLHHVAWPESDWMGAVLRPFEPVLKRDVLDGDADDNQIASVFGRWILPAAGFELYGEYGREDHAFVLRDLLLEPDHTRLYMLGGAKVWPSGEGWWVLRAELLNSSRTQLVRLRDHAQAYLHHALTQGHTHRGQTIGADAVVGGGGVTVRLDRYHPSGRWSLAAIRELRGDPAGQVWTGLRYPTPLDVLYRIELEHLRLHGPWDLTMGTGAAYNMNRHFESDAVSFYLSLGARLHPGAVTSVR